MSEQFAYWAGIVDGEGTVTFVLARPRHATKNLTPTVVPMVEITNTYLPLIRKAAEFFGTYGRSAGVPSPVKRPNNRVVANAKPIFRVALKGDRAVKLCRDLLPYLLVKRKQADIVVDFAEHAPRFKTTRFTQREVNKRLSYVSRIRKLNRKGIQ